MRPELAAFHELGTLVRNLGDQLAGYRRRALTAELRTRELEIASEELRASVAAAEALAERSALELSEVREQLGKQQAEILGKPVAPVPTESPVHDLFVPTSATSPSLPDRALARENAELKTRLIEATARTRELSDRLRFLRQQMSAVSDK